jgi:hypothetical protein
MKLIEFGVLPVIIKSLKDCGEHRGVYFTGCSAIANIARTGMPPSSNTFELMFYNNFYLIGRGSS